MTGYFRLFLAYLVLLSHVGPGVVHGFNLGVWAVVIFYILAGHVVTYLLDKIFAHKPLSLFFLERALRIYPLYWFACLNTLIFLLFTHYGSPKLAFLPLFLNFLIIPLNYYMYLQKYEVILTAVNPPFGWWPIPPAWSLGAELQAYFLLALLHPFLFLRLFSLWFSFSIYTMANFSFINTDFWGYRLIPGVFFIFLLGSILQRIKTCQAHFLEKLSLLTAYCLCLFQFAYLVLIRHFSTPYLRETLSGILLGVPLVYFFIHFPKKLPLNRFAGSLSYAVFLFHFLAIWILKFFKLTLSSLLWVISVTLITLFFSFIGVFLVDKKVEKLRYRLSSKKSSARTR